MSALLHTDRAIGVEGERDAHAVEQLRKILVGKEGSIKLVTADGQAIEVPASIRRLLQEVTLILAQGGTMVWMPIFEKLTVQQAAAFLDLPESFVNQLLERDEVPSTLDGAQRYIQVEDLLLWRERWEQERRRFLADMLEQAQSAGTYR